MKRIRSLWAWLDLDERDAFFFAGLAFTGVGVGTYSWPAGLVAVGVVCLFVALRRPPPPPQVERRG